MNQPLKKIDYHIQEIVEDKEDKVLSAINEFETVKHSDEIIEEWQKKFEKNPCSFFEEENLKKIKQYSIGRRIAFLSRASLYINVTPDMARGYFEVFPEDLKAVDALFTTYRKGRPEDGSEYCLFSIVAQEIEKISKNFPYDTQTYVPEKKTFVNSNQYLEIAKRRNIAPQILLENGNFYSTDNFKKFGKATKGYFEVLKEANELSIRGDHFLDVRRMFGEEFSRLPDAERAEFLRMALVNIHLNLVSEEAYNSCFTRERVEDDKRRSLEQVKEHGRGMHNVAHSMIFKTYQPTSVYDNKQEKFEYTMSNTAAGGGYVEEYADHRIILEILKKMKSTTADKKKNIDLLIDFWNKSRNPIFGNAVAEALNAQDVNLSAAKLLELLKKETGDRNHISAILYRLEFGQIGISEKGVKYLEKMYNLGELNNPDYFVQRLTAKGDVGVFDDKRILQKHFNLGDLTTNKEIIAPQIHDFVYETLFREKEGETAEERREREKYLQEFRENYFGFYDDKFFKQTGVRFNNLDFKEQGWFLLCYKNADQKKQEKLINFVQQFGERGLVSFLSLEYNDNNGDKILEINDKFEREYVEKIFSSYVRIQAKTQKLEEIMKKSKILYGKGISEETRKRLRENIYDAMMSRTTDILSTAYKIAQSGEAKANFYTDREVKVAGVEEVIEAMNVYEDLLEKIKGFFDEDSQFQFNFAGSTKYEELLIHNFIVSDKETGEKSYSALSLRGEGTNKHLKNFEYDGEARINFLFNNEPISPNIQNKSRKEATTFRLDRECLTFDELGKKVISKDNTSENGRLSLDFGSIYEDSGHKNTVLSRVISVGNYYNSQEKKKAPEYYHNKEAFYSELGQADIFKKIVEMIDDFIKLKYIDNKKQLEKAA